MGSHCRLLGILEQRGAKVSFVSFYFHHTHLSCFFLENANVTTDHTKLMSCYVLLATVLLLFPVIVVYIVILTLLFLVSMFPTQVPLTKTAQVELLEVQPSGAKSLSNLGKQCILTKFWAIAVH